MTTITRCYRFSASHRLHTGELSPRENAQLYGKCNNPFGHGHNYVLEVSAGGPVNPVTGLILPVSKLDRLVDTQVLRLFAFRNINVDVPQFSVLVPTTENIASVIAGLMRENWRSYIDEPGVHLERIHVQETDRNGFEILMRDSRLTQPNGSQAESVPVHA